MRVFIVRHGEAAGAASDGERPLTDTGFTQAGAAGALLVDEMPRHILHSPKLRTTQTAQTIAAAGAGIDAKVEDSLLPPSSGAAVAAAIDRCDDGPVVLVSHLPLVAELVGWLTTGNERDYTLPGFPPAGVVALDMDHAGAGQADIAWYAFPPDYEVIG